MIDRIIRALIEGRLLKSTIGKLLQKIFLKIDFCVGDLFIYLVMRKEPLNNRKIMFKTFQGEYVCNEKYICEEIMKRAESYDIVWVHNSEQNGGVSSYEFPSNVTVVEDNSLDFYRELARAKVIIINSYLTLYRKVKLKKDQILLETWHGSLGIKKPIRNSMESKEWLSAMQRTARLTTYVISNSKFENMVYKDTFWKEYKIVQWGHARNDILFRNAQHQSIREKVYKAYKIPLSKKLVLYAPTYRIPCSFEKYNISIEDTLNAMQEKWGGDWILAVKYHPSIRGLVEKENRLLGNRVVDVSDYIDMQEVLIASDAGISDYSSWMFDYLFLHRPCFIYAPDLEEYQKNRGLYYSIEQTPFSYSGDMQMLIRNIKKFDENKYRDDIQNFLKRVGCMEQGSACDTIIGFIAEQMTQ